jgi:hypothetical protein
MYENEKTKLRARMEEMWVTESEKPGLLHKLVARVIYSLYALMERDLPLEAIFALLAILGTFLSYGPNLVKLLLKLFA